MKTRYGFVSNSSSSSFVVSLDDITAKQLRMLLELDRTTVGRCGDSWSISMDDKTVRGYTHMDNGGAEDGLHRWMVDHKFNMDAVEWSDY